MSDEFFNECAKIYIEKLVNKEFLIDRFIVICDQLNIENIEEEYRVEYN